MRQREYIDERGRKYLVRQPEGVSEDELNICPMIGPPDVVDILGFPEELATKLHNRLYELGVMTLKDANANPQLLTSAFQYVMKESVQALHHAYIDADEPE